MFQGCHFISANVEKEHVYDFLAGLNLEYDQIRVQVLGRSPFPTLCEPYALVQQEESQHSAIVHSSIQDRSALVVAPTTHDPKPSSVQFGSKGTLVDRDRLKCDYCGKDRHDHEHCWKLNGRLTPGCGRGSTACSQAHVSEIVSSTSCDPSTLSSDELNTLRRLMARLESPSTAVPTTSASFNFAHTGTGYEEND